MNNIFHKMFYTECGTNSTEKVSRIDAIVSHNQVVRHFSYSAQYFPSNTTYVTSHRYLVFILPVMPTMATTEQQYACVPAINFDIDCKQFDQPYIPLTMPM